jgi:heat shock protein HslJ
MKLIACLPDFVSFPALVSLPAIFLLACQNPAPAPAKQQADTAKQQADTATTVTPAPPITDTTSLGGTWVLQPVLDSDTATGKIPWLDLDLVKSKFTGNTGCNTMHGQFWFSKNDSSLSFGDKVAAGKMACPGYNEPAFLKSLSSTTHFRLHNGVLTLLADDNMEISRWTRRPAPPANSLKG